MCLLLIKLLANILLRCKKSKLLKNLNGFFYLEYWWRCFLQIPTFLEEFFMVASDTSDQADVNNCIASKVDVSEKAFFMSTSLICPWLKRPNSSALYMFFSLYFDRIVGRDVSFYAFVISGVTDLDSPNTSLNEILYWVFQTCN